MEHNRAMHEMYLAAVEMLRGKDPAELAKKAAVTYADGVFTLPSLGQVYHIAYPDWRFDRAVEPWHLLLMLHYLNLADGTPLTGRPCTLSELPDGLIRGTKFDRTASETLTAILRQKSEAEIEERLMALGGEKLPGSADLSVRLPFLPRFPVTINIWFADEEFPPSAKLLLDAAAGHYLTIEDAVTVGEVLLKLLAE